MNGIKDNPAQKFDLKIFKDNFPLVGSNFNTCTMSKITNRSMEMKMVVGIADSHDLGISIPIANDIRTTQIT